jgi:transcriptional regulator with XRE-family HTH domain
VAKARPEVVGTLTIRLLREKREALGLSMNAVATAAGLSHTMISRVERGLRNPTLDTLLRIAAAMNIELWPLLKEAESDSPLPKSVAQSK